MEVVLLATAVKAISAFQVQGLDLQFRRMALVRAGMEVREIIVLLTH
jgi:hypothetical protein